MKWSIQSETKYVIWNVFVCVRAVAIQMKWKWYYCESRVNNEKMSVFFVVFSVTSEIIIFVYE